ncbi:ATPase, T2SS/T4P/T4SS family, partial [Escherichia coli]|uniref:ATPase, T2SS/T4P/T4SS family n=1 Tax=Escherichia coli TaxID=562 RepID=UPI00137A9F27
SKPFQVTNTPQGGSTPEMLDTRFKMVLPARFVRQYGLKPRSDRRGQDLPYRISIRVGYIRTFDGYTAVCRLLDQQRTPGLPDLGLSLSLLRALRRAMHEPSGLILVSGPTGSGKTTTLYAILQELIDGQNSVSTIENPCRV